MLQRCRGHPAALDTTAPPGVACLAAAGEPMKKCSICGTPFLEGVYVYDPVAKVDMYLCHDCDGEVEE